MLVRKEDGIQLGLDPITYPVRPFHKVLVNRTLTGKARVPEALRVFQDAFLDQVSDRVEVDGSAVAAESQRFERDGATASKAVKNPRRSVRVSLGD